MASDAVRKHLGLGSNDGNNNSSSSSTLRFVSISLLEPPKKEYLRGPLLTPDDCELAEAIVQSSETVATALKERYGIDDISRVACDPWSVHLAGPAAAAETERLVNWRRKSKSKNKNDETDDDDWVPGRLVQTFLYHRQYGDGLEDNHYAHPIDIVPIVDLNARTVVTIDGMDRNPPPKIPTASVQYHRDLLATNSYLETSWRRSSSGGNANGSANSVAPLDVVQPEGPGFVVGTEDGNGNANANGNGNHVEWQKWKFRVGFDHREGLILREVSYDGRPVLHRASLVEMAVPYADPNPPFHRKCAFDVGDYGLGFCANSLSLGCDCLGHIHYFDATLSDSEGEPYVLKNAVCMHEEDAGILWKHVEYRNGHNESRRARELIVSSIATVVNYEYLFYWHFRQDGCLDFKIKLSGELSTNLLSRCEEEDNNDYQQPTHGVMVAPGVNAQIHQHMFCARLDMAVGSHKNSVSEVDVVSNNSNNNPYGNAFRVEERLLRTEKGAKRRCNAETARCWKISNADNDDDNDDDDDEEGGTKTKNKNINPWTGKPVAYKLIPFASGPSQPTLLTSPTSAVSTKGAFATEHLWVTQHKDDERYPAGDFTVQGDGSDGLPKWIEADRNLEGEDVVLWHSFGVTHVPRSEDFPVMPCEVTGFTLKPDGFFDGNPAIDIEPTVNNASELAGGCCDRG
eukprot:jgi/Psemu1/243692/estExt_Genewise1.C_3750016